MKKKKNKKLEALILAGQRCSNCCYNLGQSAGSRIDLSAAISMLESSVAWDVAKKEFFLVAKR